VEASSLIQREYEQKVCFRATKTKGKKRNLFLAALSADFYFLQLAVNRVQDQPQLLTLFMAAMS